MQPCFFFFKKAAIITMIVRHICRLVPMATCVPSEIPVPKEVAVIIEKKNKKITVRCPSRVQFTPK